MEEGKEIQVLNRLTCNKYDSLSLLKTLKPTRRERERERERGKNRRLKQICSRFLFIVFSLFTCASSFHVLKIKSN